MEHKTLEENLTQEYRAAARLLRLFNQKTYDLAEHVVQKLEAKNKEKIYDKDIYHTVHRSYTNPSETFRFSETELDFNETNFVVVLQKTNLNKNLTQKVKLYSEPEFVTNQKAFQDHLHGSRRVVDEKGKEYGILASYERGNQENTQAKHYVAVTVYDKQPVAVFMDAQTKQIEKEIVIDYGFYPDPEKELTK